MRGWLAILASLAAMSCAVGPDFKRPDAPKVQGYVTGSAPKETVAAQGREQRFEEGGKIAADWWRLFGSPALDAVVRDALAHNPSVQAAQASLRRSQDSLRAGYGVFVPQVDAGAGASRQQASPLRFGLNAPSNTFNLFTLSGTVSYTLDIWGGQRRAVEALRAQVDAQRYTLLGAYLMLSGNVVNTVIAQAGYRAQLAATEQAIALEKEQLRVAEAQVEGGTATRSSALSIKSQIASTEASLPALAQKIDEADHLLATLQGLPPASGRRMMVALGEIVLPQDLPVSLPSKLVRQRPDILVSEAELHASSAEIGVATAAMLPNLTLSAGYGANNTSVADVFGPNSSFWNLGAGVTAPIFHGGSLYYQRRAAVDAYEQSLALYRQTVLSAFEQVADSLRGLEHDAEALKAQTEAVETAWEALQLLQANYQAGIATYLQVLVANGQYLQANIGFIQAAAQRLQDTVALYVALGGGWWGSAG